MRRIARLVFATFLVSVLLPSFATAAFAAVEAASSELAIGAQPSKNQRAPAAAYLGGRSVVAWEDVTGLFARFYDGAGANVGPTVNLAANDPLPEVPFDAVLTLHRQPRIVTRGSDGFLLVWVEQRVRIRSYWFHESRTLLSSRVMARLFDGQAAPRARAWEVASGRSELTRPAVVADAQGYWVAWQQTAGEGKGIHLRRVAENGRPGAQLAVSTAGARPALGVAGNRVLVAWEQRTGPANRVQIHARLFGTDGAPFGGAMQLTAGGYQSEQAAIVAGREGEFLVAWQHSPDGRHAHIYGQLLSRSGAALGPELTLNAGEGDQGAPRLANLPDGGYLVSWVLWYGTYSSAVQAAAFDALGNPRGDVVRVSLGPVTGPWSVSLAPGPAGKVLAVWEGGDESRQLALRGRLLQTSP